MSQSDSTLKATHTTPKKHYVDDLVFSFSAANNGGCTVKVRREAFSVSHCPGYANMFQNMTYHSRAGSLGVLSNLIKQLDLSRCMEGVAARLGFHKGFVGPCVNIKLEISPLIIIVQLGKEASF